MTISNPYSHPILEETELLNRGVVTFSKACEISKKLRQENKKLVFTSGVWDILHVAHLHYLLYLHRRGDMLIVGIDNNQGVQKIKGEAAPLFDEKDRAQVISSLRFVDYAFIFSGVWQVEHLLYLQPKFVGIPSYDPNMQDKMRKIQLANINIKPIITPPFLRNNSSSRKARQISNDYLLSNTTIDEPDD